MFPRATRWLAAAAVAVSLSAVVIEARAGKSIIAQIQSILPGIVPSANHPPDGVPGPTTRTVIGGQSATVSHDHFQVIPLTGAAPLVVAFNTLGNPATKIMFGDGSEVNLVAGYCSRDNCSVTHEYHLPGTYTVAFYYLSNRTYSTIVRVK